jgi:hypothetical protein
MPEPTAFQLRYGLLAPAYSLPLLNERRMFVSIQASELTRAVAVCPGVADPEVILAVRRGFDALLSPG